MTHVSLKSRGALALCVAMLCMLAGPSAADGAAPSQAPKLSPFLEAQLARIPSGDDGVKNLSADLGTRLELSAEQQEQIQPALADWTARAGRMREKLLSGEISPLAFSMQFDMASRAVARKVEQKLTPEQVEQYRALLEQERREITEATQQGN